MAILNSLHTIHQKKMPTKLRRNYLDLCFSKLKKKPLPIQSSPITASTADRHRPTRQFSSAAAFITNYNSLYEVTTTYESNSSPKPFCASANDGGGDPDTYVAVDFVTAFTSHRFFFSSPGRSNSIIESTTATAITTAAESRTTSLSSSSSASSDDAGELIFNNSFAIPTYSPDPYADFRQSMQEMVEAREGITNSTKSSWEFLHELLLCYLALNPKITHKHILKAFADVAKAIKPPLPLLQPPGVLEEDECRGPKPESTVDRGGCEITGQQNDRD